MVVESIKTGEPKGYEVASLSRPKTDAEVKCEQLTVALAKAMEENAALRAKVQELEVKVLEMEAGSKTRVGQTLTDAKTLDTVLNE